MEHPTTDQPRARRKRRTKAEIKADQALADIAFLEALAFGTVETVGDVAELQPIKPDVTPKWLATPFFHHTTMQDDVPKLMQHQVVYPKMTLEDHVHRSLWKLATIISHADAMTAKLREMHQMSFSDPVLEGQLRGLRDQIDMITVESRRIRNNLKDAWAMGEIFIIINFQDGSSKCDTVSDLAPSALAKALKRYAFIRSIPFNYRNVDLVITKDDIPFLIEPELAYAYKRMKPVDRWKAFKIRYDATMTPAIAA